MPAPTAGITAATREGGTATWSDSAIQSRFPRARDASDQPSGGFCDALADAMTLVSARGGLIGVERRRFAVGVADQIIIDPTSAIPTITLIDSEQAVNGPAIPTRYELNLNAETTMLELFV